MRIIDAHTHIFPEKIVDKAVHSIGNFYDLNMEGGGRAEQLIKSGAEIGAEYYVVHSVATVPRQVKSINSFIIEEGQKHPEFICFATLHPFMENIEEEIDKVLESGYKGIKLHPDFQEFNIDSPEAEVIYKRVGNKLPIQMHMGDKKRPYSKPKMLARMMDKYPDVVFIAAHFGGYQEWDEAEEYLIGRNVYMDTSSSLAFLTPEEAAYKIRAHGADKMLFGTDYPMWAHKDEIERFNALELTEQEREDILFNNAAKLFGILQK